jgi:sugar phosphate permease
MALENAPAEVRGLLSGILQQGYSFAYVLVACCNLIVGGRTDSWRETFWVGAAFSIGVGVLRIFFGESRQFLEAKALAKVQSQENQNKQPQSGWRIFWHNFCAMMRAEWGLVLYCVLMMTAFNSYSHTSQDNYTTFMLTQKELGNAGASRASILMKTGACVGGTIMGYASQFVGRRRAAVFAAVASLFMIPAWIIPNTEAGLSAGAFFMQFFVQGAWSVVPVHLNELSPPAFRSSFPGVTYQVGNMLSAPAAQIVNALAESHYVRNPSGHKVEAYGPVMAIVTTIVAIIIVITLGSGPERTGRHFEEALPAAVETELGTLSHHHQPATK